MMNHSINRTKPAVKSKQKNQKDIHHETYLKKQTYDYLYHLMFA